MNKLVDADRRIIAAIDLDATVSVPEIARRTNLQRHTVTYHVEKLLREGVIKEMRMAVNRSAVGLTDYIVYMQGVTGAKEKFLQAAGRNRLVTWLGELGGHYQWGVTVSTRRASDVQQAIGQLCEASLGVAQRALVIRHRFTNYPRRYLAALKGYSKPLVYGVDVDSVALDSVDKKILGAATSRGFNSLRALAQSLGMPPSTLQRRLDKMSSSGLLLRYYYPFDPTSVGISVYQIFISLRQLGRDSAKEIHTFALDCRAVTGVMECSGAWDFMLVVELEDPRALSTILQRLYDQLGATLTSLETSEVLNYHKASRVDFD